MTAPLRKGDTAWIARPYRSPPSVESVTILRVFAHRARYRQAGGGEDTVGKPALHATQADAARDVLRWARSQDMAGTLASAVARHAKAIDSADGARAYAIAEAGRRYVTDTNRAEAELQAAHASYAATIEALAALRALVEGADEVDRG